jgi:hypothetical protein
MGQKKGNENTCADYKKERRNYRCGKKKAFTANEGAVGGKKENWKEVKVAKRWRLFPANASRRFQQRPHATKPRLTPKVFRELKFATAS